MVNSIQIKRFNATLVVIFLGVVYLISKLWLFEEKHHNELESSREAKAFQRVASKLEADARDQFKAIVNKVFFESRYGDGSDLYDLYKIGGLHTQMRGMEMIENGNIRIFRDLSDALKDVENVTLSKIPNPDGKYNMTILTFAKADLGTLIFLYASLYGIAKANNHVPLIYIGNPIRTDFKRLKTNVTSVWQPGFKYKKVTEAPDCCRYYEGMTDLQNAHLELVGHFKSWRYFEHVESDIREQLLNGNIDRTIAERFIKKNRLKHSVPKEAPTIGIHVKRTLRPEISVKYGDRLAPKDYILRAISYFQRKFPSSLFIVTSDDMSWCRKNLILKNVVFLDKVRKAESMDLALLVYCNHTILTTGPLGWWGAWMNRGQAVYYKDWPLHGSVLHKQVEVGDYYLPHWIGM
ncbi:galactoside 2-alpha-L-fucosyltransferase 2 [Lingula anatina]|uniref:L-Fucosyltransferase n=1 Tax=Lingula anatina TaxID=7574 RepID=A0A1S3HA51_LINAN|nr:galactoside 2-alpha-L-fucosyltransferase 2 [Lingula anatina]XP_023931101.1 galactoside 2-alpha-L-fucosyltransferase 2 [Lingula anatina]|eukprot:XP_013382346.2 galactoside 2-alpha-L-fucosyltransferase 2 [Lingula anatina]